MNQTSSKDLLSSTYGAVEASSSSPSSVPRQSKVILQRQYREKEGECFNALRDVINELTGEELQTRQEILRKAIDLLLAASKIRKLREVQVVHPTPYATSPFTAGEPTTIHTGDSAEPYWLQTWDYRGESNAQSFYRVPQPRGQQHHVMLDWSSARHWAGS